MEPPLAAGKPLLTAPAFYVMDRQQPRPAAVLLAILIAVVALSSVAYGLGHSRAKHFRDGDSSTSRFSNTAAAGTPKTDEDEKDDPSQIDTIVLGDAADAPVPARRDNHISNVHATILVRLPRYGEQVGLIPDSPAGHLLYGWLAAFNQGSYPALQQVLPNVAPAAAAAAQMELRQQTGGLNLLSAKEVQPGVLVFRLRDQTPSATEVLGTLQIRPNSSPAAIASFSLRAVLPSGRNGAAGVSAMHPNSMR